MQNILLSGLTTSEAKAKLKQHGLNELPSAKPKSIWGIALEVMKEPMFLLLISCGTLYLILGDYKEGIILLSTISLIIGITFYQYQKTERALESLKNLSSPRALVLRDGEEQRIPGREVVPGDVLILVEGDRVAADADIVASAQLLIDESILTGESVPVLKSAKSLKSTENKVFSGSLILSGKGRALVQKTGAHTLLGGIGTSLQAIEQTDTKMQREMKVLVRNFGVAGALVTLVVIGMFYLTRGNFIQAILTGLSSAMAILPEEFPVVLTVFLALGAWRLSKNNVLTRKPSAIETLGSATVLCSDKTGTITQNKMMVGALATMQGVVENPYLISLSEAEKHVLTIAQHATPPDSHDPMERAIVQGMAHPAPLLREYPFTREHMAMTRVVQVADEKLACCKGAPENVINLCALHEKERLAWIEQMHQMAAQGLRVLAIATAKVLGALPDKQMDFDFRMVGLLGLADPIRPEVPQAVKECQEAGVKVIMITGDFPETARSIGSKIGLPPNGKIITGTELSAMTDEALAREIKDVHIFARVLPEQKLRIVQVLKQSGEVVAMTGDGVNDAPALKAADIGVAMGLKGTDVSREAASLVLLDDNFASIVGAIRQGRKIYDNLQKAMSYILAIHVPIVGLTLLPAFIATLPLLLLPLHIVFMELIIDPVCSVAFEAEGEEEGLMKRPPRASTSTFFNKKEIMLSLMNGLLLLGMVLLVYWDSLAEGHTEGEVRAIAFSALIIGNIFLIISSLSKSRMAWRVAMEENSTTRWIIFGAIALLLTILHVPTLQGVFSFEFPGYTHFGTSLIGAAVLLTVLEYIKWIRKPKQKFN